MMNRRSLHRQALGLGASALLALALPTWAADEAPDALIQRVSADALQTLRTDKSFQNGDLPKIVALVDKVVMPHVDFRRMTASAVGPGWRKATPDQQARLQQESKTLRKLSKARRRNVSIPAVLILAHPCWICRSDAMETDCLCRYLNKT